MLPGPSTAHSMTLAEEQEPVTRKQTWGEPKNLELGSERKQDSACSDGEMILKILNLMISSGAIRF